MGGVSVHSDAQFTVMLSRAWVVSVHSDAEPGVVSQFTVTLQSEEQVAAEWCREPGRAATLTSYGKSHEFCLHTRKTHVSLPIPLTATPAFVTDMGEGVAGVRGGGGGGGGLGATSLEPIVENQPKSAWPFWNPNHDE